VCCDLASSAGEGERDRGGRVAGQVFIFALPSSFTCVVSQVKWVVIIRLKPLSHAFCEGRSVRPASSFLPPDSPRQQLGRFIFQRPEESARNPNHRHTFKTASLQSLCLPHNRKRGWGGVTPFFLLSASLYSVPLWQIQLLQQLAASFSLFAFFYACVPFVFNRLQPLSQKTGGVGRTLCPDQKSPPQFSFLRPSKVRADIRLD
jgi:hypothetical protein